MSGAANTLAARTTQLRAFAIAVVLLWSAVAIRNAALGHPRTAAVQGAGALLSVGFFLASRKPGSERRLATIGHLALASWSLLLLATALLNGATSVTPFLLLVLPPVAAYVLGIRQAMIWAVVTTVGCTAVVLVGWLGLVRPEFEPGPLELVFGHYAIMQVALVVIAVASRRSTDMQLAAVRASEQKIRLQAAELGVARDAALEGARAKSAFLAAMSHELRTPLNAVIGMATLLGRSNLPRRERERVETIRLSGETLLSLIGDILDLSKAEAGRLELEEVAFDLTACVEESLEQVLPAASAKRLVLSYELSADCPPTIISDPTRLRQILLNLLSNATKFTESGTVSVLVSARDLASGRKELAFSVVDTGPGVATGAQSSLFQPFSQLGAATTRKFGGTGLGLAICRELCERLGGSIGVESEVGRGATFRFTIQAGTRASMDPPRSPRYEAALVIADDAVVARRIAAHLRRIGMRADIGVSLDPDAVEAPKGCQLAIVDVADEAHGEAIARALLRKGSNLEVVLYVDEQASSAGPSGILTLARPFRLTRLLPAIDAASGSPAESSKRRPAAPLHVLVVDDNAVNRLVAVQMLRDLGHEAEEAASGAAAVTRAKAGGIDLVLMDLQMPEMDGIEATQALRAAMGSDGPRVVGLTASAQPEERDRCMAAGMSGFLTKPVRIRVLADTLGAMGGAAPSANPESTLPPEDVVLDPVVIEELQSIMNSDGTPLLASLTARFGEHAEKTVREMRAALPGGELGSIARLAHALRGEASTLGAKAASRAAGRLEDVALGKTQGDVEALLDELSRQIAEATTALARIRA